MSLDIKIGPEIREREERILFHKIDSFVLLRQKKTKVAFSEILSLRRILPEVCELLHFQLQGNISIFLRSTLSGKNDFQTSMACGEELQVGWGHTRRNFLGVPTKGFFLAKLEFCDIGKSAAFFPTAHPSAQDLGGARDFYGRIVVEPTVSLKKTFTLQERI